MNLDATGVPKSFPGSLNGCLIDGDPLQQRRARHIRRRAIFFSLVFQTIALAALLVIPLLGKGERLSTKISVPLPPFRLGAPQSAGESGARDPARNQKPCLFCKTFITHGFAVPNHPDGPREPVPGLPPGMGSAPTGNPLGVLDGIELVHRIPARPGEDHDPFQEHQRVSIRHIDPAQITHRVEPSYPTLGIQLRRETRVELHAIISTDGTIQSLQVISGDPLFYQSAIDAVRQWRYTPTLLNEQPVEVDTHLTVIYSLHH